MKRFVYLPAKPNAHKMKGKESLLPVFQKDFEKNSGIHSKYHQNYSHKISRLKCSTQSKYFSRSDENDTKT